MKVIINNNDLTELFNIHPKHWGETLMAHINEAELDLGRCIITVEESDKNDEQNPDHEQL